MIIDFLRNIKHLIVQKRATKAISRKAIFLGDRQNIDSRASINHHFGSSQKNIELDDHSELFGKISCWGPNCKVKIGRWAKIGFDTSINCADSIEIGAFTAIANNVTIVDHNFHPINPADRKYMRQTPHGSFERSPLVADRKPIVIGENVWIGNDSRICKGVTIGDNSIIGSNSIVTKNIPANCIAVGNPARVVKSDIHILTEPTLSSIK